MASMTQPLLPFLWPMLRQPSRVIRKHIQVPQATRLYATEIISEHSAHDTVSEHAAHLDPPPSDYGRSLFADKATLDITAGSGGHGCVSFLREKFISDGPPNGGNGGDGGNIYIQAIREETSLHKLGRMRNVKAGHGKNGQGGSKGGKRGDDVLIQVPVGTVVRETSRSDPFAEEEDRRLMVEGGSSTGNEEMVGEHRRDKWILYPAANASEFARTDFPPLPRARRTNVAASQPPAPIYMDLSQPMERPMLLAAGAVGGYGNPHFISKSMNRPKMATKGDRGMSLSLELELKLLADVGFVGMPNAGKSTLLRALSKSRTRVGDWAFTTLHPNIGTVVLDNHRSRPQFQARRSTGEPRTHVSIADIPGLVEDAHLDRGLGLGFLRHVERAQVLAFVVDLGGESAIESLKILWRELGEFEKLKSKETNLRTESRMVDWQPLNARGFDSEQSIIIPAPTTRKLEPLSTAPISSKPWFVVATKADLERSQHNFQQLQAYLEALTQGRVDHPSGNQNSWKGTVGVIPVSAIRGEGVERIPEWTVSLLQD